MIAAGAQRHIHVSNQQHAYSAGTQQLTSIAMNKAAMRNLFYHLGTSCVSNLSFLLFSIVA
jgi:hypothetical protein